METISLLSSKISLSQGSTVPELARSNGIYTALWRRLDGVWIHALRPQPAGLEIGDRNVKALNRPVRSSRSSPECLPPVPSRSI